MKKDRSEYLLELIHAENKDIENLFSEEYVCVLHL